MAITRVKPARCSGAPPTKETAPRSGYDPGLRFAHPTGLGKRLDYLVFEDEGHDVLKRPNRVRCYKTIVDFFR